MTAPQETVVKGTLHSAPVNPGEPAAIEKRRICNHCADELSWTLVAGIDPHLILELSRSTTMMPTGVLFLSHLVALTFLSPVLSHWPQYVALSTNW